MGSSEPSLKSPVSWTQGFLESAHVFAVDLVQGGVLHPTRVPAVGDPFPILGGEDPRRDQDYEHEIKGSGPEQWQKHPLKHQ